MSASANTKSICNHADGFSFVDNDGYKYISVKGLCTAIPGTGVGREASDIFFSTTYPDNGGMAILSDTISELNVRILYGIDCKVLESIREQYPDIPIRCNVTDIIMDIRQSDKDAIAAVPNGENADIIAVQDGRLMLLKQVPADTYRLLYNITKIWKEFGFNTGKARIRLYGLQENTGLVSGLVQMTGEDTLCVL